MQQKEYSAKQEEMNRVHSAIYQMVMQNAVGGEAETVSQKVSFLSERLTHYMNTCHPGVFDIKDTLGADNQEFLQMAYYSMLGTLPDDAILTKWKEKADGDTWEFRKAVMEALLSMPEITVKNIVVCNNIYSAEGRTGRKSRQSLKQKILFGGYQISRKLPNGIKVPLKKIAMKFLMK